MVKANRKTADNALAFLETQRLEPTPLHYSLAFMYTTGADKMLTKAVDDITDGGVRLTAGEAEGVMRGYGYTAPGVAANDDVATESDVEAGLRHQLLKIAEINETSSNATSRFGKDLAENISAMAASPENLVALVSKMIERTTAAELELAKTAEQTAQLRQDLEAARNDASIDMLTGLINRRSIDGVLAKLAADNTSRAIAFVDVDKFKSVNDRFGHAVGDRVLKGVSEILRNVCGDHGTVARWGGEEFVVVFENPKSLEYAADIVDKARIALTAKNFKLREDDQPLGTISFSAGVVIGTTETNDSLTQRADELLYRAKEEGRNRIIHQ